MKKVCEGIKLMKGHQDELGGKLVQKTENKEYTYKLNTFFCHFGCHDFTEYRNKPREALNNVLKEDSEEQDINVLRADNFSKSTLKRQPVLTQLNLSILRNCANQLPKILYIIFNLSLSNSGVSLSFPRTTQA